MTELKFEDMTAAASGDRQNMLGKLLYFSLPSVLVDKDDLRQLCGDMNIPYAGGNRLSVSDAFRSATGDVRDRIISEEYGERRIYQIYCRDNRRISDSVISRELVKETMHQETNQYEKLANISYDKDSQIFSYDNLAYDSQIDAMAYCRRAEELFELYQRCANRRQVETISLCTKNNYIVAQMFLCLFPRRSIRLVRKKKLTLLQRNYWRQPLNYCHCFPIGRCVFQTFH